MGFLDLLERVGNMLGNLPAPMQGGTVPYGTFPEYKYSEQENAVKRQRGYLKGLSGLNRQTREDWEQKHLNNIKGLSPTMKDEYYRNTVFTDLFKNSDSEEDKAIWNSRKELSYRQRDLYVAKKLFGKKEEFEDRMPHTPYEYEKSQRAFSNLLHDESKEEIDLFKSQINNLDTQTKSKVLEELDAFSNEISPYYKKYNGTDKLNMSEQERLELFAKFSAWDSVGGSAFAQKALGEYYQNKVAGNQTYTEKAINSGAQFIDTMNGMGIRAAGMIWGLGHLNRVGTDYWKNVIDNDITRYGDDIVTTNSYNKEEQKKLKELGLSDNQILETAEQQEQIISVNTPFKLAGEYGFTAFGTAVSFGGSALASMAAKGATMMARAATAGRGLNTTAKGIKLVKAITRGEDVANFLVVGGVASIEGGMNAAKTREETSKKLNSDIYNRYYQKAQEDIASQVMKDPQGAAYILRKKGYDIPERIGITMEEQKQGNLYSKEEINQMINLLQNDRDAINASMKKYTKNIEEERKIAEDKADIAMYTDFIGNSLVNGFLHSTLSASLNAPKIQNSLRKAGLASSPLDKIGVSIANKGGKWAANANKYTRWNAFSNRLKESLSEGLEEYAQSISSAFAQGYAEDSYTQYLKNKYDGKMEDAISTDMVHGFSAGVASLLGKSMSEEAIKEGLYGGLSTFMGGINVNSNILNGTRGSNKRKDGEGLLSYAARVSPVEWRSGIAPLIRGTEANIVNERRNEVAKNINTFFENKDNQEVFFNVVGTTKWMQQMQQAVDNKDEKAARDANLGVLFSNVMTLNSIKGSGYYDAAIASLKERANLNADNLKDEESMESKLVSQFKQDAINRDQEMTNEEALDAIKSSANTMLETIERVDKETESIEKLYGNEMDKDVKAGLILQRLSTEDSKRRLDKLNDELSEVSTELTKEEISKSSLNNEGKSLIANYGNLENAKARQEEIKTDLIKAKEEIKKVKEAEKEAVSTSEKVDAFEYRRAVETFISDAQEELKKLNTQISNYESFASTNTDKDGNIIANNNTVLSASEIMGLDAETRANMLNPENKSKYSEAQQEEIDRVNRVGIEKYQDFSSKIVDSSRLTFSHRASLQKQLEMMQDPKAFMKEAIGIKKSAQERMLRKKYDYLKTFEKEGDYASFAAEMDRLYSEGNPDNLIAVISNLDSSEFINRYNQERKETDNLNQSLQTNEVHNSLEDNDKKVLYDTFRYLKSIGVDYNDVEASAEALAQKNEEGDSLFEKFVNHVNENSSEQHATVFTSEEQAITNYRNVINEYLKDKKEKESNSKEIPVTSTPVEAAAPVRVPNANSTEESKSTSTSEEAPLSIFDMAYKSAEEAGATNQKLESEGIEKDPITQAYEINSGKEVADASQLVSNIINNSSTNTSSQGAKDLALQEVRRLSDVKYDNVDEYAEALAIAADRLNEESEDKNSDTTVASNLLKSAIAKVKAKAEKAKELPVQTPNTPSFNGYQLGTAPIQNSNTNANSMATINIAALKERYPDNPIVQYYERMGIEDFLKSDFMSTRPTIMFMSDSFLAKEVKRYIEDGGGTYTQDNIPLIAVVEVESGGITVNINGVSKQVQPIGVMPKTGELNSSGSKRLAPIRSLIDSNNPDSIIKDENGNIVTTTINGNVIAEPPRQLHKSEPNRSVVNLQINDLSKEQKQQVKGMSKTERRGTSIYKALKKNFLDRVTVLTNPKTGKKYLGYIVSNLKGGKIDFILFTTPVHLTRDKNSERLISELFNSNDNDATLKSNSRIKRAADTLKKVFSDKFDIDSLSFEENENGEIVPTNSTQLALSKMSEDLTNRLGKFLSLPASDSWKYVITPTNEFLSDGRMMFELSITNALGSTIKLGRVTKGQMQAETQFNILKNLIMNGSTVRMVDERNSFVKWNVPYSEFANMENDPQARSNISDLYDDGIFEVSKDSLNYKIKCVNINSPFNSSGQVNYSTQNVISNPTNAQPTTPLNKPTIAANDQVTTTIGTVVDSESGLVLGHEETSKSKKSENQAKSIVEKMVAKSKLVTLSENGKFYVDKNGKKYARVTSIIQADSGSENRFDPNSPWITPSTNIGTGIDEFVRDFFAKSKKRKVKRTPLKQSFKGKLIYAQSGTGKTSIADNIDVFDSDFILANILGVPTPLAMDAFNLLNGQEKKKIGEIYRQAIRDKVKEGKTVITANNKMIEEADVVIYNESVELTNERTSDTNRGNRFSNLEYHQQSLNTILQYKGSKELISLSKNQYLASILTDNPNFNIQNEVIKEYDSINDVVNDFMSNFGISLEQATEQGYTIDYLDRVIKGANRQELVEGAGEMIAFMMQYNGQAKDIIAKMAIESGAIKKENLYNSNGTINTTAYKELDKSKYLKVLGKAISTELQAQFKEIKTGKVRTKIDEFISSIKNIIDEFFGIVTKHEDIINEVSQFSRYVARNVLTDNPSLITSSLRKPGDEDAGKVEKLDAEKALSENPYELNIIKELSKLDFTLTGSLALATQGTVYRPSENPLHDLDFVVPTSMDRKSLEEQIEKIFPNITHIRTINNDNDESTESYLVVDVPFTVESTGAGISIIKNTETGEQIGTFRGNDLNLNAGVKGKIIDFFLNDKSKDIPYKYNYKGETLLMNSQKSIMKNKLKYGRLKDIFDYNRFVKAEDRTYPNATKEQYNHLEQQLQTLKNQLDAEGLTVVPRDIIATGSVEVTDSNGNKHNINVAGTLDLIAYDENGRFYIFDMKTNHSENLEYKKDKWRKQLTLYKTFLEQEYEIDVHYIGIIPIKVEYPDPKGFRNATAEYTAGENNQLYINGKEFRDANPDMRAVIPLSPIDMNILFDKLTKEEKQQITESEAATEEISEVSEVKAEEKEKFSLDQSTGLKMGEVKVKRKKKGKGGAETKKKISKPTLITSNHKWGVFENATTTNGEAIDAAETLKNLEKAGITEEQWNEMSNEERQQELDCKGATK